MRISSLIISIFLTLFSTIVLAYISMATMLGPWIAPTVVLFAGLIFKLMKQDLSPDEKNKEISIIQSISAGGGIIATAVGFTLPTLYFLDKPCFDNLLAQPITFCALITTITLAAGSIGIVLGRAFAPKLLTAPFPVSQLIHQTITSQTNHKEATKMLTGFSISSIICIVRDYLPTGKTFAVLPSIFQNSFLITLSPMFWAIGFISGASIALPLFIGLLSKYFLLPPLNIHAQYLPFQLFPIQSPELFMMAFCSGLILADPDLLFLPLHIWKSIKNFNVSSTSAKAFISFETIFALALTISLFSALKFPILAQLFILLLTVIATYQISTISGKIGLVQFGRFATMVMIPSILIFSLSALQITMLCVFVSICAATATDLLFDYKVGELCSISHSKMYKYQWLGLLITALGLGFFMWLLFSNLHLGTSELFAQRGRGRALMVQSVNFNLVVVLLGLLYGLLLKRFKINPSMVFSGIFMPHELTLGFIFGSLGARFTKNPKDYSLVFSGMFAAESIWMILSFLAKLF